MGGFNFNLESHKIRMDGWSAHLHHFLSVSPAPWCSGLWLVRSETWTSISCFVSWNVLKHLNDMMLPPPSFTHVSMFIESKHLRSRSARRHNPQTEDVVWNLPGCRWSDGLFLAERPFSPSDSHRLLFWRWFMFHTRTVWKLGPKLICF